jgi:hypothetical protein
MSLAAEHREGPPEADRHLPPRLRHASEAGALRPLNIRVLRGSGGPIKLLRILMTNACALNCHYCPMRRDRAMRRTLLKPEELVRIFLGALRRVGAKGCSSRPASRRVRKGHGRPDRRARMLPR